MKLLLLGRVQIKVILNLFGLGLLRVAGWLEGEGGGECPRPNNSKTISDNKMKFSGVENHKLINLVLFNWLIT